MDENLNTPQALALLWELVHDGNISNADKRATLLDFDKVFGFGLDGLKVELIPEYFKSIYQARRSKRRVKIGQLAI